MPPDERLAGTLASDVGLAPGWARGSSGRTRSLETRQVLDMVASIRGDLPPARAVRALA